MSGDTRQVHALAKRVLGGAGFEIVEENRRHPEAGARIDQVADDRIGTRWHFAVSGSLTAARAGLSRSDTMWKTLGRASALSGAGVTTLILLTTDLPARGSPGDKALRAARHDFFDAIEMLTADGEARLAAYARGEHTRPLPGFLSPEEIFGAEIAESPGFGARFHVPVSETGDPLGRLHDEYQIEGLPHRLKVLVPSKLGNGEMIDETRRGDVITAIRQRLSELGGGCTSQEEEGTWIDPLAGAVDEQVLVIETYASRPFDEGVIRPIVELILEDLDQHAVAVLVDDRMLQFVR